MPVGYWLTLPIVAVERIRRVAVHVFPRVRGGFHEARQTQSTTESTLVVLVLVERRLRSAANARKQRHRNVSAAEPIAREVPRIDLLEGPFLRIWAFYKATAARAVGRERRATELVRARLARPDPAFRYRPDKRRKK